MNEKIKKYLKEIELEKDIKILLACETGSRAWGFPSPDSDYDIRIIYVHKIDWYLSLVEGKDTIELMLENNDLDITGWDLRKVLRLLWKSNPPLLERIQSPIMYIQDKEFLEGITILAKENYSKIATIHHYLGMAKKSFDEINNNNPFKLKKFFYALRTSIACLWISERNEIPPIEFQELIKGLDFDLRLKERIFELIHLKSTIGESYLHKNENDLQLFIKECINKAEINAPHLSSSNAKMENLNSFFIQMLNKL